MIVAIEAGEDKDAKDVETAVDKPGQTQQQKQKHHSLDKAIAEEQEDEDEAEVVCMALISMRLGTMKY